MATISLTILSSKPTRFGKYPIFVCICSKREREYIKTEYKLDEVHQLYNGKVVARPDPTMMNKRLLFDYCLGHSGKSKGVIRFYTKVKLKQAEIVINRMIDYMNSPEKYKDYIEMKADIMMMRR